MMNWIYLILTHVPCEADILFPPFSIVSILALQDKKPCEQTPPQAMEKRDGPTWSLGRPWNHTWNRFENLPVEFSHRIAGGNPISNSTATLQG